MSFFLIFFFFFFFFLKKNKKKVLSINYYFLTFNIGAIFFFPNQK